MKKKVEGRGWCGKIMEWCGKVTIKQCGNARKQNDFLFMSNDPFVIF